MNIEDFILKYIQSDSSVFQPTPPANITDEDMRIFADDIRKVFSTENIEDSVEPLMTKRIGFYKNGFFTGVEVSYHRETDNIRFFLVRNDTTVLDLSFLSGNRLNNTELVNCEVLGSSLESIAEHNIINKTHLYKAISEAVYDDTIQTGNQIILPNTNVRDARTKKFFVKEGTVEEAQASNLDFFFYYDYSYLSVPESALGDEFEIFFKAYQDGSVYFSTFNYDYFSDIMEVFAERYYKLSVSIMPKYNDGTPHVWANLTPIATPIEN